MNKKALASLPQWIRVGKFPIKIEWKLYNNDTVTFCSEKMSKDKVIACFPKLKGML